jgi:hypothetical protein
MSIICPCGCGATLLYGKICTKGARNEELNMAGQIRNRNNAPPPGCEDHEAQIDNKAVDDFATAMRSTLSVKRSEGRSGWHDPAQCSVDDLGEMLLDHIIKGDMVDVANFCMMLHHRCEGNSQLVRRAIGSKKVSVAQVISIPIWK